MLKPTKSLSDRTRRNRTPSGWPIPPIGFQKTAKSADGLEVPANYDSVFRTLTEVDDRPPYARIGCVMLLALNVTLWTVRHAEIPVPTPESLAPSSDAARPEAPTKGEG